MFTFTLTDKEKAVLARALDVYIETASAAEQNWLASEEGFVHMALWHKLIRDNPHVVFSSEDDFTNPTYDIFPESDFIDPAYDIFSKWPIK